MKKLYLSGWHIYANLSGVSGVDLYDYDTINYSYITIKFKDGSVYSYTSDDNSINMIRAMATLAIIGIDFSGYNAKLDEVRLDCTYKQKEKACFWAIYCYRHSGWIWCRFATI